MTTRISDTTESQDKEEGYFVWSRTALEKVTWDTSAWNATHDVTNRSSVVACRELHPAHGDVQNMEEATSPAPSQD